MVFVLRDHVRELAPRAHRWPPKCLYNGHESSAVRNTITLMRTYMRLESAHTGGAGVTVAAM